MTYELRTFVCKHCGHEVVRNPNLPPDAKPSVCGTCWENIERPKAERGARELFLKLENLFELLGIPPDKRF